VLREPEPVHRTSVVGAVAGNAIEGAQNLAEYIIGYYDYRLHAPGPGRLDGVVVRVAAVTHDIHVLVRRIRKVVVGVWIVAADALDAGDHATDWIGLKQRAQWKDVGIVDLVVAGAIHHISGCAAHIRELADRTERKSLGYGQVESPRVRHFVVVHVVGADRAAIQRTAGGRNVRVVVDLGERRQ